MKKEQRLTISFVIPVFNEEERLPQGLDKAINYLRTQTYTSEIIIVNDGSIDNSSNLAQSLLRQFPHQIVEHKVNHGKGAALKTGVKCAKGKYIVFSDADFSAPVTELPKLLAALKTTQVAIGVRRHPQAHVVRHQPFLREALGHAFTKLTNFLVAPGISDATCGFKGFRKDAAHKLFTRSKISRWAFDAEILFLARKYRYTVTQVPITWADNSATKVHILRDGMRAFFDLLKIRLFDIVGLYNN